MTSRDTSGEEETMMKGITEAADQNEGVGRILTLGDQHPQVEEIGTMIDGEGLPLLSIQDPGLQIVDGEGIPLLGIQDPLLQIADGDLLIAESHIQIGMIEVAGVMDMFMAEEMTVDNLYHERIQRIGRTNVNGS
jgi:hypothetical protein